VAKGSTIHAGRPVYAGAARDKFESDNALKFTPEGGEITLRGLHDGTNPFESSGYRARHSLEAQSRLFAKLHADSASDRFTGFVLGLTIVKSSSTKSQRVVKSRSCRTGKGSRFIVSLLTNLTVHALVFYFLRPCNG